MTGWFHHTCKYLKRRDQQDLQISLTFPPQILTIFLHSETHQNVTLTLHILPYLQESFGLQIIRSSPLQPPPTALGRILTALILKCLNPNDLLSQLAERSVLIPIQSALSTTYYQVIVDHRDPSGCLFRTLWLQQDGYYWLQSLQNITTTHQRTPVPTVLLIPVIFRLQSCKVSSSFSLLSNFSTKFILTTAKLTKSRKGKQPVYLWCIQLLLKMYTWLPL